MRPGAAGAPGRGAVRWAMAVRETDVVVIGAGVAGLAAARRIAEAGCACEIVEARRRIGGRVWTVRDAAFPLPVEMGAEFVHGEPEATLALLREAGVTRYDVPAEHWQRRGSRLAPIDLGRELSVLGRLRVRGRDRSLADVLREQGRRFPGLSVRMARAFVEGFDAADPERVSARSVVEEQEGLGDVSGQKQSRVLGGYGALAAFLWERAKGAGAGLRLGWPVTTVRWARGRVQVEGPRGSVRARAAVVTLPVGVLQRMDGPGAVRFMPEAPTQRDAAARLGSGPVVKVVMAFSEAFWERAAGRATGAGQFADFTFVHDTGAAIPTWWSALPMRAPVLTGWAGGPKAEALSARGERGVVDAAVASLADLLGVPARRVRRLMVAARMHDWVGDPWSRGAYSYELVGARGARRQLARPVMGTLFFAGEAADMSGQASTVAGALTSGDRAGRAAARAVGKRARRGRAGR